MLYFKIVNLGGFVCAAFSLAAYTVNILEILLEMP